MIDLGWCNLPVTDDGKLELFKLLWLKRYIIEVRTIASNLYQLIYVGIFKMKFEVESFLSMSVRDDLESI